MRVDPTAPRPVRYGSQPARPGADLKTAAVIAELQRRDREVRAHEAAHAAAGGGLVRGGPSFRYVRGPDGRPYAVAGEVQIDTSPARDPETTIAKMETVRRAALAPARPSSQDLAVAARAAQEEARARVELLQHPGDGRAGARIDVTA
ncbi:MAG: hypothetical protein GXP50_13085 [Deltaproteobacteria bacterium]|nr:hypothetical protein [Deltaproteobacteria bacterium]